MTDTATGFTPGIGGSVAIALQTIPGGKTATSAVVASPSPTTTTFSVTPGDGAKYVADVAVTVGTQTSTISGVVTDAITVSPAFSLAPSTDDVVTQLTLNVTGQAGYVSASAGQFLKVQTDGLQGKPDMHVDDTFSQGRDSDSGHRTGKSKTGGPLGMALYARNGVPAIVGAIGKAAYLAALDSDTTAAIVSAAGVSVATMTAGDDEGTIGAPALIDTAGKQEVRQLLTYDVDTKAATFALLRKAHTSSGTVIAFPAAHYITPLDDTDGNLKYLLRSFSLEDTVGGNYAYAYPEGYIGKWTLKAAAAKVEQTIEVMCNDDRFRLTDGPTAINRAEDSLADLAFQFTDGFAAFSADPFSTGTPTLQLVRDFQDFTITVDNHLAQEACFDETGTYRNYPIERTVTVDFQMLNSANRPVIWEDFLTQNVEIPFFLQMRQNIGTPTEPVWQGMFFRFPHVRFTESTEIKDGKKIVGEQVKATCKAVGGDPKIELWILNDVEVAY